MRIAPAAGTRLSETPSEGTLVHSASDEKSSTTRGSCAASGHATVMMIAADARELVDRDPMLMPQTLSRGPRGRKAGSPAPSLSAPWLLPFHAPRHDPTNVVPLEKEKDDEHGHDRQHRAGHH